MTTPAKRQKWDKRFMSLAKHIAGWSKHPVVQVGAVVVDDDRNIRVTGYNGPPRGVRDDVPERWERPLRSLYASHAEENTVSQAARNGISIRDCTIYVSGLPPCAPCARMLIQAAIKRVVVEDMEVPDKWKESCTEAQVMLHEAGIKLWRVSIDE